jgi:uncharacterized protein (DUF1684 family)
MLRRSLILLLAYRAEIEAWRRNREAELKAEGSWLALTGLVWLRDGVPHTVEGVGTFVRRGAHVMFGGRELRPNTKDAAASGTVTVRALERSGRLGLRIWDNASAARREFRGCRWFPLDESWRIAARFVAYGTPKQIPIANVLGDTLQLESPGYAEFARDRKTYRLDPVVDDEGLLFLLHDTTSARETYGAGRFLYTPVAKDGSLVLDFNRAENPPCAFTPYATCPLPPKQNHLPLRIAAGEMTYKAR